MVGSAGAAIVFVVSLAAFGIWVVIYSTFVGHYVLTTLTETSAGSDVVEYPGGTWLDWWWKPILCLWVFSVWCVPISLLCLPLASAGFWPYFVTFAILFSAIYPLSLSSILFRQSWLSLLDATVVWRTLRHLVKFLYVLVVTLSLIALCVALLFVSATQSWAWLALFTVLTPLTMLLWARHWGRLAWLTLNHKPTNRKSKVRRKMREQAVEAEAAPPEIDVEEVIETPPPMPATAIVPAAVEVEEDEWATDKAPYATVGFEAEVNTAIPSVTPGPAVPFSIVAYYDKRAENEANEKAEREREIRIAPPARRKPPSFRTAMFVGIWSFPFQRRAIVAWINLALLTLIGVCLLAMLGVFRPPV